MGVLSFCAQQDSRASQFLNNVSVFKRLLEAQTGSETQQFQNGTSELSNSGFTRPPGHYMPTCGSSSGAASFHNLPIPELASLTSSSTFEQPTYSSTGSFSVPQIFHVQHTSAQTGTRIDTYPYSFACDPLNDFGQGADELIRQHYQPFLQDLRSHEDMV